MKRRTFLWLSAGALVACSKGGPAEADASSSETPETPPEFDLEEVERNLIEQLKSARGPEGKTVVLDKDPDIDQDEAEQIARREAPEGYQFDGMLRLDSGKEVRFYVPIKTDKTVDGVED